MTDNEHEDAEEILYQTARQGLDARIANPKCKNISHTFSQDYEWTTIRAVVGRLREHYGKLGYLCRLDTRPYHAGARAKIHLTQNRHWV
jgi:hypothetical protein